jgi:NADH-quinone oxidoreductase subunit C
MDLEKIKATLEANIPGCRLEIIPNPSPSAQHSLLVDPAQGAAVAQFLRDNEGFDYCSNVTGLDFPPKELSEKIKVKKLVDGVEKEVDEVRKTSVPGYLEVVYHLFSGCEPKTVLRASTCRR